MQQREVRIASMEANFSAHVWARASRIGVASPRRKNSCGLSRRTSTICIKPRALLRNASSSCTAIRPMRPALAATSAMSCHGYANALKRRMKRPDCPAAAATSNRQRFLSARPCRVAAMQRAEELTLACDLFIAVGSSLVVWPAAGFPLMAKRNGSALVIINREPTDFDNLADLVVRHDIGEALAPFCLIIAQSHWDVHRRMRKLHFCLLHRASVLSSIFRDSSKRPEETPLSGGVRRHVVRRD